MGPEWLEQQLEPLKVVSAARDRTRSGEIGRRGRRRSDGEVFAPALRAAGQLPSACFVACERQREIDLARIESSHQISRFTDRLRD